MIAVIALVFSILAMVFTFDMLRRINDVVTRVNESNKEIWERFSEHADMMKRLAHIINTLSEDRSWSDNSEANTGSCPTSTPRE